MSLVALQPDAAALNRARQQGYAEGVEWATQRMPYLLAKAREDGARDAADAVYAAVADGLRLFREHPAASAIEGDFHEHELRSAHA